jgi:acetyltransferase-like isoleucine patch superfamily enzyme
MKRFLQKLFYEIYEFLFTQHRRYIFKQNIEKGYLVMGNHSYGNPEVHTYKGSEAKVVIGKYCSIGPNCLFITGGIHPTNWVSTYPFRAKWNLEGKEKDGMPSTKGDIIVDNDVWIGSNVTILSGVHIGDGAVICTGAVVTKDVGAYSIVGGVPAKEFKKRFDQETIEKLLKIKWWDWEEEKIRKWIPFLSSPNVDNFLRKIG